MTTVIQFSRGSPVTRRIERANELLERKTPTSGSLMASESWRNTLNGRVGNGKFAERSSVIDFVLREQPIVRTGRSSRVRTLSGPIYLPA